MAKLRLVMNSVALAAAFAMSLAPLAARACACCGEEDEQFVHAIEQDTDYWEVLGKLRLGAGWLTHAQTEGWETTGGWFAGAAFLFKSDAGAFKFVPNLERSEYWTSDISFITRPDKEATGMADMLHQVVFRGTLLLPTTAASAFGRDSLEATLALRGVGTACMEASTLRRWQLSAELPRGGWLTGGGPIQEKEK